MNSAQPTGLTAAEVAERIRRGQVNRTPSSELADYLNIINRNVLTLFNLMVTPAAIALFFFSNKIAGGIAVSGMAIVNTVIGLVQEIRAKRYLDKLAILVETKAHVVRDGKEQQIPASQVVLGDHILLTAGETIVADGPVLEDRYLEVDEALLTGESDPVRKKPNDPLLSGSFCVAGEGMYRADKVGAEAFANSTAAQARRYSYTASPLTTIINLLIQVLSYTAVALCLLYTAVWWFGGALPTGDLWAQIAATITSMVPQGMVLTATISFTLGAVHMSSRGAIVQRLNAVEAMAAVDVVCTDKTGTLTTNRLTVDQVRSVANQSEEDLRRLLSQFASASVDRKNKSVQALREKFGQAEVELLDQLPFKSQNRYSAVRIRADSAERVLVLGACEALAEHLENRAAGNWEAAWKELLQTGLRVLLFAESPRLAPFVGTLDGYPLRALALIALSDELRPEAGQVLEALHAQGIAFKVISGDNAETVRATVSHLNLPLARDPVVTGAELEAAGDKKGALLVQRSVFGRVSPLQKVAIVEALKKEGRYVAMIGDGVNDVLPIKRAHLGIAMGEGSQASKTVSGLVLENNNFALLPETLEEGRTIIRNLRRSGKLFLTKNVYSLILLALGGLGVFGLPFPYVPQQVTLLNWLVIGIPAFIIALSRERSTAATKPDFLREVGWFAIRTGVVFALAGLTILLLSVHVWADPALPPADQLKIHRTLLLSVLILLGITALLRALTDGEPQPLRGDTKFRWLAVAAVPVNLLMMYTPLPARFFDLAPLDLQQWALVGGVAAPAFVLSKISDRWRI